jgi:hypothetical protein
MDVSNEHESQTINVNRPLQGDETFMEDKNVHRTAHSEVHIVESHTNIGNTTFGPTTSTWADTAAGKLNSMAEQAETYNAWIALNPLPESVKLLRQRNIDKLAQKLANTTVKSNEQISQSGELILKRGTCGADIKKETNIEQAEFQNSLTEQEKLMLTETKIVEAEEIARHRN